MAKNKREDRQPSNPDQLTLLKLLKETAAENSVPVPSEEELRAYPNLLWLLAPMALDDPKHVGEGKPRRVLREPLFMLSWDRGAGRYKWAVMDKVLKISTYGLLDGLLDPFAAVEKQLAEKTAFVKETEVT